MMWILYRLLDRALADSIAGDLEECASARYPVSRARATLWKWHQLVGIIAAAAIACVRDAIVPARHKDAHAQGSWLSRWVAELGQDTRHAGRMFRFNPGLSLAVIITLALGIGSTTAIFSIVNALLIRSLPYEDADRLIDISERIPPELVGGTVGATMSLEASAIQDLGERARTLAGIGIHVPTDYTLMAGPDTVRISGRRVSDSIFEMLHARPALGRLFHADDYATGAERVAILSHIAWQRYFRGDRAVWMHRVRLDGDSVTIVGIMGEDFSFPDRRAEIWTPLVPSPQGQVRLPTLARLHHGVTIDSASKEISAIVAKGDPARQAGVLLLPVKEELVGPARPLLTMLMIAVGLVLLIACTNVANLLVARALVRRREIAMRAALGAGRLRLVRQVLTESVVMSIAGGIAGVVVAVGMIDVVHVIGTSLARRDLDPTLSIPRLDEVHVDMLALAFTVGLSVLAGAVVGVVPALEQTRTNASDTLRGDPGAGLSLSGRRPVQGFLIVWQIAMAMILLIAAGLQIHSFVKVAHVDPGYDASNVLTFQVLFPGDSVPADFANALIAQLERLPRVEAAGFGSSLPMIQSGFGSWVSRTPEPPRPPPGLIAGSTPEFPDVRAVTPGLLDALRVRVIDGRSLSAREPAPGLPAILINRTFARSGYLGSTPIGQQVYVGGRLAEVVGIVEDMRQVGLEQPAAPQVFVHANGSDAALYYAVRTSERPASQLPTIRQIVRRLAPDAGLHHVATMEQIVANSISRRRFYAVVMGAFAAIAATLAAVGLYGTVAYAVGLRTREIGIRIALGADAPRVLRLILREAGGIIVTGVTFGVAGALVVTRSFSSMLFELSPVDPATYVVVATFFSAVTLAAAFWAARRAAMTDPVTALRAD
jgi:putative ABC transport system permease protein